VGELPELDGATERFLIDDRPAEVDRDAVAAAAAALIADAAGHAADALPELLVLARGGGHFDARVRPYLNEAIHCLASSLEAALIASHDVGSAGVGLPRKGGEDTLAVVVRDFLDRSVA